MMAKSKRKELKSEVKDLALRATEKTLLKLAKSLEKEVPAKVSLNTIYEINSSEVEITLEVIAGDAGQKSMMLIKLDEDVIAENIDGNFNEQAIGTNQALHERKLAIVANIADLSRETNLTSLAIHLKHGREDASFPLKKTVDKEGDSVDYKCLIEFFDPLR